MTSGTTKIKNALTNTLKRRTDAHMTPPLKKKSKTTSDSSRLDSESISGAPTFNAKIVSSSYRPKPTELLKTFDAIADGQSLVSQAQGFYRSASRICIENGNEWDAMHRYKTAVYMGTSFGIGDDVLVMQEATSDDKSGLPSELKGRWVGRILEIRATSGANVHVLINWYNRPEDLPKRREAYHSMNEVLATNDVDIIAPTSLAGKMDVNHWVESDETAPPDRTIFWRQCLAIEEEGKPRFSKLKTVCTCNKPVNVDKTLVNCESCDSWIHDECLIADLAKKQGMPEKKWKRFVEKDQDGALPEVLPNEFKLIPPKGKPWVVDMQTDNGMFVSENRDGKRWEAKIECLKCGAWLR